MMESLGNIVYRSLISAHKYKNKNEDWYNTLIRLIGLELGDYCNGIYISSGFWFKKIPSNIVSSYKNLIHYKKINKKKENKFNIVIIEKDNYKLYQKISKYMDNKEHIIISKVDILNSIDIKSIVDIFYVPKITDIAILVMRTDGYQKNKLNMLKICKLNDIDQILLNGLTSKNIITKDQLINRITIKYSYRTSILEIIDIVDRITELLIPLPTFKNSKNTNSYSYIINNNVNIYEIANEIIGLKRKSL